MLASLVRELLGLGLGDAKQVLLTGTSAGGVAAMLQADNVRAMLPTTVEKFKAISFAGWFRTNASACKDATRCPWPGAMQHAFTMQNMRGSDDDKEKACLRKHGWRCMHSGLAARRVKAPLFVVQSALDSWSLANIWRGSDPEQTREVSKRSCIGSCFESCSVEETDDLNGSVSACAPPPPIPAPPPEPPPPTPTRHRAAAAATAAAAAIGVARSQLKCRHLHEQVLRLPWSPTSPITCCFAPATARSSPTAARTSCTNSRGTSSTAHSRKASP